MLHQTNRRINEWHISLQFGFHQTFPGAELRGSVARGTWCKKPEETKGKGCKGVREADSLTGFGKGSPHLNALLPVPLKLGVGAKPKCHPPKYDVLIMRWYQLISFDIEDSMVIFQRNCGLTVCVNPSPRVPRGMWWPPGGSSATSFKSPDCQLFATLCSSQQCLVGEAAWIPPFICRDSWIIHIISTPGSQWVHWVVIRNLVICCSQVDWRSNVGGWNRHWRMAASLNHILWLWLT